MAFRLYTGFHAVEEKVRSVSDSAEKNPDMTIFYSKPGPRIKKIISLAKKTGIACSDCTSETLDTMVKSLPQIARDHRGIVLQVAGEEEPAENLVDFDQWISGLDSAGNAKKTVLVLDSITDPHNVGAILRSSDQFGSSLVVVPERRGASDVSNNDIIARSSAGASAWVPVSVVKNLVRSVQLLKEKGFWVYGADAGGTSVQELKFADKSVIIMGSEGNGIARLLQEQCDTIVSIPTCGKIDSLNVSVAAGVLLYERYRQAL